MAEITSALVGKLREMTNAGLMDCKNALVEAQGDLSGAVDILRKKGQASAAKKAGREAKEGLIAQAVVNGGKAGALVEINCETDFVARNEQFRKLAHEIALQIAASSPKYITAEEIPAAELEHEAEIARARAKEEGKPDNVTPKIVEGRIEKYKDEVCLMRQAYIRDESISIEKLILQNVAAIGENIIVRRFQRWELGESIKN